MSIENTAQALAAITDEGLFERLATAILREANPIYGALGHPGMNVAGKTIKSPLDGICFELGASPPHMIAVHHTVTALYGLKNKWLNNPSSVKASGRKIRQPQPAGDVIKTAALAAEERARTPELRVTLVLTTNQEPTEDLVRDVTAAGRSLGLEIDIWPRSRLSHFLNSSPAGQWIRRSHLDIDQEQLSSELLHELAKKSLDAHRPLDDATAWVPRAVDTALANNVRNGVTFLVAGSGLGKSIACYRALAAHVNSGGFGIVLRHNEVAAARTLAQAVATTLHQLHPALATTPLSAFSFCSADRPLLLVIEDINRSEQPAHLAEKLAGWSRPQGKEADTPHSWRLLCPLWPEVLATMSEQARKCIEPLVMVASGFTESEGRDAVLARARINGRELTPLSAEAISRALGHDPLLVALHDQNTAPDPHRIIGQYAEGCLARAALVAKDHPAADYHQALYTLANEMLTNRQFDLSWREIRGWARLQPDSLRLLSLLAHRAELIHFNGPPGDQRLSFRHDRVRDWLLADAATELDRQHLLADDVVAEPYFAEVMGAVLVREQRNSAFLQRAASTNPLVLFHAIRLAGQTTALHMDAVVQAISDWLDIPTTHERSNLHLRWQALAVLAETDSSKVPEMVRKFRDRTTSGQLARLRNGDITGGIELCYDIEPGAEAPWRDIQIAHAKSRYGPLLTNNLGEILKQDGDGYTRIGALRLAGHIADASLAPAIEDCWTKDGERRDHLAEYLWAFGQCCGDDPARFLGPVCEAWAALPAESTKTGSPSSRTQVAADQLRWAFRKWPPLAAIDFFVQWGSKEDLRLPMTHMLHGMDHPKAVLFVTQELATIARRVERTDSFSFFLMKAKRDWRDAQEIHGRPMSISSRDVLLDLWRSDAEDKHLRTQAFSLWAATIAFDDLALLRAAKPAGDLADKILWERLVRGDLSAIPMLIEKLETDDHDHWWQCGRHIWSPELTETLDECLDKRGASARRVWGEHVKSDWITSELIMQLPAMEAERLLLKHWHHLRFGPCFVQTALYVSTPSLLEGVQTAINECPEPAKLLDHLQSHFGIRTRGRPGISREDQILALAPFLHLLSPVDCGTLWEECNSRGWIAIRHKFLDGLLQPPFLQFLWNANSVAAQLDKLVSDRHPNWIDRWIDGFLKTGASWIEILDSVTTWFDHRRSIEALDVVAAAIVHRGTRQDLGSLRIYDGIPETAAKQIIADTEFAVRRRSIH